MSEAALTSKTQARNYFLDCRRSRDSKAFHSYNHTVQGLGEELLASLCRDMGRDMGRDLGAGLGAGFKAEPVRVAAFLPQNREPGSRLLLEFFLAHHIAVYCPSIPSVGATALVWKPYTGPEVVGRFSIPEPDTDIVYAGNDFAAVFAPAVALSTSGDRLGRGGGFYDRFLAGVSCRVYAMVFASELVPHGVWQADAWDVPVEFCIDEERGITRTRP